MSTSLRLAGTYDLRLVALSISIAVCSAYAALDLASQIHTSDGKRRLAWLAGGSLAMGVGIWAMHYVGMEAFRLPVAVEYDWPTVVLSILAAVLASAIALAEVSQPVRTNASTRMAGLFMGLGIASMHYIGMNAMRLPAMHLYSPSLFLLSIVVAVVLSIAALQLGFAPRNNPGRPSGRKFVSALMMGLAISAMHYVGMAAVTFQPMSAMNGSLAHAVTVSSLALASICIAVSILLITVLLMAGIARQSSIQTQELAQHRMNTQTIFDSLREAIVVFDRNQHIVQTNRAFDEFFAPTEAGHVDTSLKHKHSFATFEIFLPTGELLPPENWPSAMALRGQFVQSRELKIRRRDTLKLIFVDVSTAPITNAAGETVQVIVSLRDITLPKETDEARVRLAAIVDSSEDAIIGKTPDGIVNSWNAGAEKVFGYSAAEMIGQSVLRLLPDDRLHEEDEILSRIRRGEFVNHIETIRKKKNGQFINVSLMISPILDSGGKVIGASKIARNITDRKDLERRLYQSQKMDAIGQLTGGIAHDFNNLLGVIIGNLDLLERQVATNEPALRRVNTARNASLRAADLTRRLLAFSSKEDLRPDATDLDTVIKNVLTMASPALGPEIKVTTQLHSSIPSVFADAAGLESAILNLIVNARDSMPEGGNLTITSEVRDFDAGGFVPDAVDLPPGPYACVSISDTGHGMSPEVATKAFDPFFTTKPRGKGTGLGLAMVYGFFRQSGGTVRIYSEPGYGTTVSFYLPIMLGSFAVKPPVVVEPIVDTGGTILVVDDEPELLEIASSSLVEVGYHVHTAQDAESALAMLAAHPEIDMLLTDIIMPGAMNGVELAQEAVHRRPLLRVIFCSGFPADALAERILPAVDGPLLRKPYQRTELIAMVRGFSASSAVPGHIS